MTTYRDCFLIISNGRAGSTYLMTTLGLLPGVETDYEVTWTRETGENPIHKVLHGPGQNCRAIIESISPTAQIVGSKLTFYKERFLTQDDTLGIISCLDPEIKTIHLVRDYWEILLSSFARGYIHVLSADHVGNESQKVTIEAVKAGYPSQNSAPPLTKVEDDLDTLKNTLLCFFVNDLVASDIVQNTRESKTVFYESINDSIPEIGDWLGIEASSVVYADIVAKPRVKKLPPIPDHHIPHCEVLKPFAQNLNECIRLLKKDNAPVSTIWDGRDNLLI